MPWSDDDIRENFHREPEKGEALVQARKIMGTFLMAKQYGTLHLLKPLPGTRYPLAYVERNIAFINRRWEIERDSGRGRPYKQSADFDSMPLEQQVALVQRLRHAMGRSVYL